MILRLVTYDIENNQMRTKMAKLLLQFGFIRLQKSVFCGQHNEDQWNKCKSKIDQNFEKWHSEGDSLYTIIIGRKSFEKMLILGEIPDFDMILNKKSVLWI